jgi:predicted nucleic acid-binding protein
VRLIVSDTGPLLHLHEAQALGLIALAGEVHIPIGVDQEISHHEASWPNNKPSWISVDSLIAPYDAEADTWRQARLLDSGEAQAIALARQLNADWLLTDDASARLLGQTMGLEVHGSLGVVLWAAAVGHLTRIEAESALVRLARSSLWVSARILEEAKAALDQMFP